MGEGPSVYKTTPLLDNLGHPAVYRLQTYPTSQALAGPCPLRQAGRLSDFVTAPKLAASQDKKRPPKPRTTHWVWMAVPCSAVGEARKHSCRPWLLFPGGTQLMACQLRKCFHLWKKQRVKKQF